jgi:cellulase
MAHTLSFLTWVLLGLATAQTPGKLPEVHPKLQTWECTKKGGCVKQNSAIVLDQLAHPVHQLKAPTLDCGSWGSAPNVTVCPDEATCAKNCIVEGISDYSKYGISTKGDKVTLHQLLKDGTQVSPRAYLLNEKGDKYEMLKLTGREISFDADVSKLPCGMNGALYMSEMEEDGGRSRLNPGGATYGSGYCDAQCFTLPFINGVVSISSNILCGSGIANGNMKGKH